MRPIQQLLNRIQWDEEFGKGEFLVGIYDRVGDAIEFLPLDRLHFEKGNHFSFTVSMEGEEVSIPFHRIREVYKDGQLIWQRPATD